MILFAVLFVLYLCSVAPALGGTLIVMWGLWSVAKHVVPTIR